MTPSGHRIRGLWLTPLLALAAMLGCTADEGSTAPSFPSLTVVGSNICGRNMLPETSVENYRAGRWISLDLVATGIDPFTASREMLEGTQVEFYIEPDTTTGRAFFSSSSDDDQVSAPVNMVGRTARTKIFCVGQGDIFVGARITSYSAGGVNPPEPVISLRSFPIRCVPEADYEETCGPVDFGMAPPPTEMGPPDMMPDAADVDQGPPPVLAPWTVRFVPPDDINALVLSIRGSAATRPDNVVLTYRVHEGDEPIANVPVLFELSGAEANDDAWPGGVLLRAEPEAVGEWDRLTGNNNPNYGPGEAEAYAQFRDAYEETFDEVLGDNGASQVAFTNGAGEVRVRVIAGEVPGSLSVRAVAFRDKKVDWDRSRPLLIRGGIPSHRGFDLDCEHSILPAFTHREVDPLLDPDRREGQTRYLMANAPGTNCRVQVADRVNGRIDREHRVFFLIEAGTVDQESGLDEDGGATTEIRVGDPPPRDVLPDEWEEAYAREVDDVILNPRDGLVRVVAFTRGEEDFHDLDGDKVFTFGTDMQEPGMQLAEPYVDANDNGVRDNDEEFRDTNGDRLWTQPLPVHQWQSSTDIWTSTTVLWTGDLRVDLEEGPTAVCDQGAGCFLPQTPGMPGACVESFANFSLALGGQVALTGTFVDDNGNCLGAYNEGEAKINLATDTGLVPGQFARRDISGQFCWEGFEKPRGKNFEWTVVNTTVENESDFDVSLTYRRINSESRTITWGFSICR